MRYIKYTLKQIPFIGFAHFFSIDKYKFEFDAIPNSFEIVHCERGEMNIEYDDRKHVINEGGVNVVTHHKPLQAYSDSCEHKHATISVNVPYDIEEITESEVIGLSKANDNSTCVYFIVASQMPYSMQVEKINLSIKKLINDYQTDVNSNNAHYISGLFNLFSMITAESIRIARLKHDPAPMPIYTVYSKKAIAYIAENIKENISTNDIASYLGISNGYLCMLFKNVTGKTVVEYINSYRIKRIKEMIVIYNMSLREAGEKVGLYDEHYLSRLFKKYTGCSFQDYKFLNTIEKI